MSRKRKKSDSSITDVILDESDHRARDIDAITARDVPPDTPETNSKTQEGIWRYIVTELTHGYELTDNEQVYSEKLRRVSTFMKTPRELEKLMLFGFFICLDAFLFLFTILPVRLVLATLSILYRIFSCSTLMCPTWQCKVSSANLIDFIRASIFGVCLVLLGWVDISALYHIIRAQSVIKLYVIYNMLEIFDRLLASIGQDTLDTLYWLVADFSRKSHYKGSFTIIFYFMIAAFYVLGVVWCLPLPVIHTSVILVQATTLSVAVNSHSKALLTIMVSNNFVELKGSVFKKFEIRNLFQMSCSDIRERFHYVVLMFVVILRNFSQWGDLSHLESMLPIVLSVIVSEVFVDCVKHAFITKFNSISPDVYRKYRLTLAKDLTDSRSKRVRGLKYKVLKLSISHHKEMAEATSEHTDLVSRRMGFIPLPLGCLLLRTITQSVDWSEVNLGWLLVLIYVSLMTVKLILGITLLKLAQRYDTNISSPKKTESEKVIVTKTDGTEQLLGRRSSMDSDVTLGSKIDLLDNPRELLKEKTKTSLSDVERFTLCSNRIV